jgi:hypothetical protein
LIKLSQDFYSDGFTPTKASVYLKPVGIPFLSNSFNYDGSPLVIDSLNFKSITQGESKLFPGDTSIGFTGAGYLEVVGNIDDYAKINIPIKTNTPGLFDVWIRGQLKSGVNFNFNLYLDDLLLNSSTNSGASSDDWIWLKGQISISDTLDHILSIQLLNNENTIDKIYIDLSSVYIPSGDGPSYTVSPFYTVHCQVYEVDENLKPTNPLFIYDFKNSFEDIKYQDWYNFNISSLDGSLITFNGNYSIVLFSSGTSESSYPLWDVIFSDEYENSPSGFKKF